MRRVSAIGLTLALFGHHGFAAAADESVLQASIARSASREASRLASHPSGATRDPGWQAVRKLDPARPIVITTASATVGRTFVAADEMTLTVLNLSVPGLSETSKRHLLELTRASPLTLVQATEGSMRLFEAFRLGPEGVFLHGMKIAELGDLIERVPIGDVLTITGRPVRRGSAVAAALGTLGGLWLGSAMALGLGYMPCQPHCGGVELGMWSSIVGVPLAAGYGAWRATSVLIEEVIYRRPIAKT